MCELVRIPAAVIFHAKHVSLLKLEVKLLNGAYFNFPTVIWISSSKFKNFDLFGPLLLTFVEIGGGGWGLELNFLGFQIEEYFWEAKFLVFI